ncbi:hypothetical protein OV203_20090 [Nannocystis sp. ILAH1]|uniref:hypothetical protein n=1 Tax=Nannocystis sp. ILAH1 TaxID=2996789 RepID=UPI002270590B|nr:hypothetical protein [Nannocystis sp. ILAH1]MCY0989451.1 hypothetical protein [Nannocystis sp. ILAH1]
MTEVLAVNLEERLEARLARIEKLMGQKKRVDALLEELEYPPRKSRGASVVALSILLVAPLTAENGPS